MITVRRNSPAAPVGVPREDPTVPQPFDRTKSLEQLDGERWGDPPTDTTSLVKNVYEWRRRPVGTLEPHELGRLIGQDVGLPWLLPPAVEILRERAAAGGFIDGDLLYAVVTRNPVVWAEHPELARELKAAVAMMTELSSYVKPDVENFLAALPEGI
ncbi:contact-dependent growth inhibition system immunity protein [Streptomyces sp. NPDC007157]|uniref:contact-dependent growth inhibition system immunity protein n=1 Tax=Streptomyces sp. NPDC007157 TaxID=3154681 RepID=UPI0033C91238